MSVKHQVSLFDQFRALWPPNNPIFTYLGKRGVNFQMWPCKLKCNPPPINVVAQDSRFHKDSCYVQGKFKNKKRTKQFAHLNLFEGLFLSSNRVSKTRWVTRCKRGALYSTQMLRSWLLAIGIVLMTRDLMKGSLKWLFSVCDVICIV